MRATLRLSILVLGTIALTSTGCGVMQTRAHDVDGPRPWPLAQGSDAAAKPTLLIRMPGVPADVAQRTKDTYTANEFKAPIESGLFSTVAYAHPGLTTSNVETDYTLDLTISHDQKLEWYTVVGLCTLGVIPVNTPDYYTVSAVFFDGDHKEIGHFSEVDHIHDTLWLPLLPLDMAFLLLPGGSYLGLDARAWDPDKRAMIEDLLATILAKANNELHFAARGPAGQH
jgi:hypothetical protein